MIGSVFLLEWLNACRRGKHHLLRLLYTILLIVEVLMLLLSWLDRPVSNERLLATAWYYLQIFTGQHFLLLFLLTPPLAAGSITDEKTRGTLILLLSTPLTSGEIILGKWLAQTTQVLALLLPGLPLIIVLGTMQGLSLAALFGFLAVTIVLALAMTAGALLMSVWARRTSLAVLSLYGLIVASWVGLGLSDWGARVQDYLLWPIVQDERIVTASAGWLVYGGIAAFCLACVGLASWRLLPATIKQLGGTTPKMLRSRSRRPVPDVEPMRWKDAQAAGITHLVPVWLRYLLVVVFAAGGEFVLGGYFGQDLLFLVAIALVAGVRCSGVVTGEREQQTWDSLLITPLESNELVRGKFWGVIDSLKPYLIVYVVIACHSALVRGEIAASFSHCLAWLATCGLLYYMAALGMYWSTASTSSWRSLAKTLTNAVVELIFYSIVFGFIMAGISVFLVLLVLAIESKFAFIDWFPGVEVLFLIFLLLCYLGLFFWGLWFRAEGLLLDAEFLVDANERCGNAKQHQPPRMFTIPAEPMVEKVVAEHNLTP